MLRTNDRKKGSVKSQSELSSFLLYSDTLSIDVRSRVKYCCPLWNPTKITVIKSIESVQRQFTRPIRGLKDTNYWDRLRELKLSPLQRRRERYMIIHVWKILQDISPVQTTSVWYSKRAQDWVKEWLYHL